MRVRTLLYEADNVLLTRTKASLKLTSWALDVAARSSMRHRPALRWPGGSP